MGWALINFLGFQAGRLFEVGAYSKVGGESNKYGRLLDYGFRRNSSKAIVFISNEVIMVVILFAKFEQLGDLVPIRLIFSKEIK